MPQAGSEIDENVSLRERTDLKQTEDMADGSGVIEDHLARRVEIAWPRLVELENIAQLLVPVVVGQAGLLPARRTLNPATECMRLSAMHDLRADGVVKLRIHGFESRAD